MSKYLKKDWILNNLIGILSILFGVVAIIFPSITVNALAIYFAIALLIGGLMLSIGSAKMRQTKHTWYFLLIEGLLAVLLGIVIIARPSMAAAVFIFFIGIWAIVLGLLFVISYFSLPLSSGRKTLLIVSGILSLACGVLFTINPFEGSRFMVILIGVYAIAYGIYSLSNTTKIYY